MSTPTVTHRIAGQRKHTRMPHGLPFQASRLAPEGTQDARAVDAITVLSGVSAQQVIKVLAAIQVIHRATPSTLEGIVSIASAPSQGVTLPATEDDPDNLARAMATEALIRHIVMTGGIGEYEYILRGERRFT